MKTNSLLNFRKLVIPGPSNLIHPLCSWLSASAQLYRWSPPSLAPVRMCCNLGSLYERTTWSTTGPASTNQSWQHGIGLPHSKRWMWKSQELELIHQDLEHLGTESLATYPLSSTIIHYHPLSSTDHFTIIKATEVIHGHPICPQDLQLLHNCPLGWCRWATFRPAKRAGSPRREPKCCFPVASWWIPPGKWEKDQKDQNDLLKITDTFLET